MVKFKLFLAAAMVMSSVSGWAGAYKPANIPAVPNLDASIPQANPNSLQGAIESANAQQPAPTPVQQAAQQAEQTPQQPAAAPASTIDNSIIDLSSAASSGGSAGNCPLMTLGNDQVANIRSEFQDVLAAKTMKLPPNATATQNKATAACATGIRTRANSVIGGISAIDKGNGAALCSLESKVQSQKYGISNGMMSAHSTASAAQSSYQGIFDTKFQGEAGFNDLNPPTLTVSCVSAGLGEKQTTDETNLGEGADGTSSNFTFCNTVCKDPALVLNNLPAECIQIAQKLEGLLTTKVGQASCYANSYATASTALKIGATAVAVGAVVGVVAIVEHQKAVKADEKNRANAANAIITVNGQTVDCKQSTTYTATACQPALMTYCSQTANLNSAGCGAFTQYYCAQSGSSVSYCLSGSSRSYCGNAVSTVPGLGSTFNSTTTTTTTLANSPACQWLSNMPVNCTTNPSQMGCLTSMSASQLATTCPSYTSDPLCQAYNAGQVVYQPTGGTTTTGTVTNTGTTTILPVATGTTTTASTGTTTTGTTTTGLGGFVGVQQQSTANLFASGSHTLSALCHGGANLMGCR